MTADASNLRVSQVPESVPDGLHVRRGYVMPTYRYTVGSA